MINELDMYHLPGEWISIDCSSYVVSESDNVTLLFKRKGSSKISFPSVDNTKIKRVSKNDFNITHLEYNDTGTYMCSNQTLRNNTRYLVIFAKYELVILHAGKVGMGCIQLHVYNNCNLIRCKLSIYALTLIYLERFEECYQRWPDYEGVCRHPVNY